MSAAEHKAAMRRIPTEVFNQGSLAVADVVIAPDYVEHVPLPPGFPTGVEGFKQFVAALRQAFPDFQYTVEDELAEGERVVLRLTARGTHRGAFQGLPPTGKQVSWTELFGAAAPAASSSNIGPTSISWACCSSSGSSRRRGSPANPTLR